MTREKDGAVRARYVGPSALRAPGEPGGVYHARYRLNGAWLRVLKDDGTPREYHDAVAAATAARLAYACAIGTVDA